jgi:Protein of unknown function (DUF3341)
VLREFLVATFRDEQGLLEGVRQVRNHGFQIYDVYAPYPVHGLDEALGLARSRLPWVTLLAGLIGLCSALSFQFYVAVFDWRLNVGGKPDNSTLAFVPITFELTVLLAGLATTAAFLLRCRLYPGARAVQFDEGATADTFAVVLRRRNTAFDAGEARRLLEQSGAEHVRQKTIEP